MRISKGYYYGFIIFIVGLILMFLVKLQYDFDIALLYLINAVIVFIIYCMFDELDKPKQKGRKTHDCDHSMNTEVFKWEFLYQVKEELMY